jgi:hypothetical protein
VFTADGSSFDVLRKSGSCQPLPAVDSRKDRVSKEMALDKWNQNLEERRRTISNRQKWCNKVDAEEGKGGSEEDNQELEGRRWGNTNLVIFSQSLAGAHHT